MMTRDDRRGAQIRRILGAGGLVLALGALSGCVEDNPAFQRGPVPLDECRRGEEVSEVFEDFERPDQLDILVVMDNSGSVGQLQRAFARALPEFLEGLDARGVAARLGVVNTDSPRPEGLAPPGTSADECGGNTAAFADSTSGGDWTRAAACNVVQGDRGEPRQQALSAAKTSLLDEPGDLAEFFRPRARRLVMVVSNEDDCSSGESLSGGSGESIRARCAQQAERLDEVERWAEEVRAELKTAEGLSIAVLSGPPVSADDGAEEVLRPVCQGALGAAYGASRLWEAADYFGPQGAFESLCVEDLDFSLARIAQQLVGQARMTICPAEPMVHEPLRVEIDAGSGDLSPADPGEAGFIFLGETDSCHNGALSIAAQELVGAERVEVKYCAD